MDLDIKIYYYILKMDCQICVSEYDDSNKFYCFGWLLIFIYKEYMFMKFTSKYL